MRNQKNTKDNVRKKKKNCEKSIKKQMKMSDLQQKNNRKTD